jgi:hypothetical protein
VFLGGDLPPRGIVLGGDLLRGDLSLDLARRGDLSLLRGDRSCLRGERPPLRLGGVLLLSLLRFFLPVTLGECVPTVLLGADCEA